MWGHPISEVPHLGCKDQVSNLISLIESISDILISASLASIKKQTKLLDTYVIYGIGYDIAINLLSNLFKGHFHSKELATFLQN